MTITSVPTERPLPPGSAGLPLIGETLRFFLNPTFLGKRFEQHGSIIRTHLFGKPTVMMIGPEANRFILASHMQHFSWGEGWPFTFKEILGESLFVQDGEEHKQKRRLMMPAFHREALRNYFGTMDSIIQRYLTKWEKLGRFTWYDENKQLTFEIASVLLAGSEPGDQTAHLSRLFTEMTAGLFTVPVNLPWTTWGKALRARDHLLAHIEEAVKARQQNTGTDVLSLLVETRDEDGNALTMRELKAQTLLLLFAGHETSTAMITSLCLALAQNPAAWEKAHAEQEALGERERLTLEDLRQMPYLDQVLKEVERLYPPVAGGFRGVTQEFEFNGYRVPQGWRVLYNIPSTHRDPRLYRDADRFDPDRFAPQREEDSAMPFSLVGFGGGPRICIGYAFAQMEMKLLAAYLLRGYIWEILPDQDLSYAFFPTSRPNDGLKVRFSRRA